MPGVAQSLVPYNPLGRPNYGDGTSYTNSIDACLAIAGQTSGCLAVVPSSPAAMSVRVDSGFNIPHIGATDPYFFQSGGTPVTVPVVAPGANSYYACIYWDLQTGTAGVVYGPTSVTPVRTLPDNLWQLPLAFILIASTAVTITAININDARFLSASRALQAALGSISASPTVNCNGADRITINLNNTNTGGMTMFLTNYRIGTPLNIAFSNTSGVTVLTKVQASTPSGANIPVVVKNSTTLITWNTTGVSLLNSATVIAHGSSVNSQVQLVMN